MRLHESARSGWSAPARAPLDLLTLRALRLIRQADVVVYDRLVGPDVLELVPAQAERIFVGKMRDRHVMPQAEINRPAGASSRAPAGGCSGSRAAIRSSSAAAARSSRRWPRRACRSRSCPGITAALGCAAYAGIPLTHRDHAQTLVFVTGHTRDGAVELDWPALTRPGQTRGLTWASRRCASLCARLIAHGLDADDHGGA